MKVLVIPEDPIHDQYILKPIVEKAFAACGRTAHIFMLPRPNVRGIAQVLKAATIADIIRDNRMMDLFILIVDRDGEQDRKVQTEALQRDHPDKLLCCLAIEEVEVWMLALHEHTASWEDDIRAERHPKEKYAEPFLRAKGWTAEVGKGRKRAMENLGAKWKRLLKRCPEVATLVEQIATRTEPA